MFWLNDDLPEKQPKLENSNLYWNTVDKLEAFACLVLGHNPMPDQCDKPEHDLCTWCQKLMPFQAKREQ